MTIANNYAPVRQIGNGVTTQVSAAWPMINAAYAKVFLENAVTGVQTPISQGGAAGQYMIALTASGWIVTMGTAWTASQYLVVVRETTLNQTDPYRTATGFQGEVEEASFDKLTAIAQEQANAAGRALRFPLGDPADGTVSSATVRAGKVQAYDPVTSAPVVSRLTLAELEAQPAGAAASAAAAAASAALADQDRIDAGNAAVAAQAAQAAAEAAAAGMKWRPSVHAATIAVLPACTYANGISGVGATLTGNANGALAALDGVTPIQGNRYLIKDQAAQLQNGTYVLTQLGTAGTPFILTRATDADTWGELVSQVVSVEQGTTQADQIFICTVNAGGTVGVTAVTWVNILVSIPDGSVTRQKLAAGAVGSDNVTTSKIANYTATNADDLVPCNANAGAFTVTLYAASSNTGRRITIRKTDTTFNVVTVDGNGSETIDGKLSINLSTQYETVTLECDGTGWYIVNRRIVSEWASYTPTFTGFGTVASISFFWRRVGDSLEIEGRFVTGATTAVEARISLPSGLTSDATKVSSLRIAGPVAYDTSGAAYLTALMESGVGYLTLGAGAGTLASNTKINGNNINANVIVSVNATVPITGWEG